MSKTFQFAALNEARYADSMTDMILYGAIILLFFILFIIAPGAIQNSKERKSVFVANISKNRANFLQDICGLTEDELKQLLFDGFYFYISERKPYKDISSISCIDMQDVGIVNSKLPHKITWIRARVDGGPDRRYRYNEPRMISRRFTLQFSGVKNYTFSVYGHPYSGHISATLEKVNHFLGIASSVELEAKYQLYEPLLRKAEDFQTSLDAATTKRSELQQVQVASQRFMACGGSEEVRKVLSNVEAELKSLEPLISRLQAEATACKAKMSSIVQDIHAEWSHKRDSQLVQSYYSSRA